MHGDELDLAGAAETTLCSPTFPRGRQVVDWRLSIYSAVRLETQAPFMKSYNHSLSLLEATKHPIPNALQSYCYLWADISNMKYAVANCSAAAAARTFLPARISSI